MVATGLDVISAILTLLLGQTETYDSMTSCHPRQLDCLQISEGRTPSFCVFSSTNDCSLSDIIVHVLTMLYAYVDARSFVKPSNMGQSRVPKGHYAPGPGHTAINTA
jgi:hypothetical protein